MHLICFIKTSVSVFKFEYAMVRSTRRMPFIRESRPSKFTYSLTLTLKMPITSAADDKFVNIFLNFRENKFAISCESSASRRFT